MNSLRELESGLIEMIGELIKAKGVEPEKLVKVCEEVENFLVSKNLRILDVMFVLGCMTGSHINACLETMGEFPSKELH